MSMTESKLRRLFPKADSTLFPHLLRAMIRYGITTKVRQAAFLAQVGHESQGMTRMQENLNYGAKGLAATWPSRYAVDPKARTKTPNALAQRLQRNPVAIANNAYANRMGNGSEDSDEGWKYRGRGLIQITGKTNYSRAANALGLPLVDHPELLEDFEHAALSAAWWWSDHGLNELADRGEFEKITRKINGGLTGYDDRVALWGDVKEALV